MGLLYSYMLYFKNDQLEDVLLGISKFAEKYFPPAKILFPDHILEIPLNPGSFEDEIICYNNPEFGFDTVLIFEEDDAIIDWGHGQEVTDKSTLAIGNHFQYPVSVGYIYLTVYNDLSAYYPEIILDLQDLVLLNFGTTGTRMSNLFYYSKSIRTQFTNLLKEHHGVCGIFNTEEQGEVFWLNGKPIHGFIDDVWLSPDEIKLKLSHK